MTRLSLLGTGLFVCSFAHAQAPAAGDAGSTKGFLEEVMVTAQKTTENIQEVPFSVSAVTGDALEKFQYKDLKDLNGTVPNVQFTQITNVALNLAPSIRGIGITNNPDPYTGTEVAVVIDGVVQGTRLLGLADQFDVERIEILRGPQGTLFGANTLGGVVNVVSKQPTGEFGGYGKVSMGNYDEFNGAVALNFPIVDQVLAGKVALSKRNRDGFYTNLFDNSDFMWVDTTKARGYLLFTPGENFKATLIAGKDRIRNGADTAANISRPGEVFYRPGITTPDVKFQLYSDSPHINRADLSTFTVNAEWDSPLGQITAIGNYMEFDAFNIQDVDALREFLLNAGRYMKSRQYSGELRSAFQPTDSINAVVGAFYMDLHHDVDTVTLIDGLAPGVFSSQRVQSDEQSIALFAQVYWDLTDKLRLGGGLRFTTIDIALRSENTSYFLADMHPYHYSDNFARAARVGGFVANGDESWTEPGGKISLDYKLAPDVMVYGYYARGFKSGGFNGRITDPLDIGPFAPEFIDSFEVGMRSDWFDKRLRANLAVFYNKWDDMQVPQSVFRGNPPQASSTILNAASATSQGVELELELAPTAALNLKVAIGYLDAAYDDFADATVDYSGRPTPYAPEWTGSLTASYEADVAGGVLTPSVQYTYTADRWATFTQYDAELLEEVSLVNANLSYAPNGSTWSVALWATNLFDEKYVTSALTVPPLFSFASFGAPRQYGVEVRFEF